MKITYLKRESEFSNVTEKYEFILISKSDYSNKNITYYWLDPKYNEIITNGDPSKQLALQTILEKIGYTKVKFLTNLEIQY